MSEAKETKVDAWFAARQRGERLPEHELPDDVWCDLCGRRATRDDYSPETDMTICNPCIEATLDASTVNTGSHLELVGGGR